jgi:hypothetical protein
VFTRQPAHVTGLQVFQQVLVAAGLLILMLGIISVLVSFIGTRILDISPAAIAGGDLPETTAGLVLMTSLMVGNQLAFGVPAVLSAAYAGNIRRFLHAHAPNWKQVALAMLTTLALIPFANWIVLEPESVNFPEGMKALEESAKQMERQAAGVFNYLTEQSSMVAVLVIGLVPAICEELFFRGYLQQSLRQKLSVHATVILVGFLFALIHFQIYGFASRWLLGIFMGYLAVWGGSVWPAVAAHLTNNSIAVMVMTVLEPQATEEQPGRDEVLQVAGEGIPAWMGVLSLVLTLGGMALYYRMRPPRHPDENEDPRATAEAHNLRVRSTAAGEQALFEDTIDNDDDAETDETPAR